jgi:hypothetical protein
MRIQRLNFRTILSLGPAVTIVVTVKINDGIVLASDSATTFTDEKGTFVNIYNNANKVFNLVKGLPLGGMTWGAGAIGSASIATIAKDLRRRLSGDDPEHREWALDIDKYTIEKVATRVREFLFEELFQGAQGAAPQANFFLGFKVCGYSAGAPLSELWDIRIINDTCEPPKLLRDQNAIGPNWDGEYESMDRLFLGLGCQFSEELKALGASADETTKVTEHMLKTLTRPVVLSGMPIQDAIELAIFMVETSSNFVKFSPGHNWVGGPVEVAAITKHEGFNWVQRKLFYRRELNP